MTDIFDEMERDAQQFQRAPTADESTAITVLATEMVTIDLRLARWAEVAKGLAERRTELAMRLLPEAMDAVGQDRIGLGSQGVDLVLDDYFKAGLPNPENAKTDTERAEMEKLRAEGIAWLTQDSPDLLNTTVVITLPKGSLETAREIVAQLTSAQGWGLDPARVEIAEGVHWKTLTSFVKEQVKGRKRSDLPLAALGATVGRIVKIVKRKER